MYERDEEGVINEEERVHLPNEWKCRGCGKEFERMPDFCDTCSTQTFDRLKKN